MGLRDSRHWDREFEQGLPDCRLALRRDSTVIHIGRARLERVFCANCGAPGGGVTAEWAAHVFYLCDPCAAKPGMTLGLVQVA